MTRRSPWRSTWRSPAALALLLFALLLAAGRAGAVEPSEMLKDPVLEARARAISKEIRCLVCQNESIDESNADLAHDLRLLVRQRLKAGDTNQQVEDYLVARYGDYVLLDPPFKAETAALWLGPALLLVMGAGAILLLLRRQRARPAPAPLSEAESRRLAELTDEIR